MEKGWDDHFLKQAREIIQKAGPKEALGFLRRARVGDEAIPLFGGRPKREGVIGRNDEFNLRIALGTARSLDEFLTTV